MTRMLQQNRHSPEFHEAEKLTLRLGGPFTEICQWAIEQRQHVALETCYHILGLNPALVGVGNLVHEFSHPESLLISSQWLGNPVAELLIRFSAAVKNTPRIDNLYGALLHRGGARQNRHLYEGYKDKTFLLTLLTHPLSDIGDPEIYTERRRLRIWLVVQAATRLMEHRVPAERSISAVARFMVLDSDDANWGVIDALLRQAIRQLAGHDNTFERYTSALANSAAALKEDPGFGSRGHQSFLNAVMRIAEGEAVPTSDNTVYIPIPVVVRQHTSRRLPVLPSENPQTDEAQPVVLEAVLEKTNDESRHFYVVDADPLASPAEQTLSSGSIYMQTMEMSHYLPWSWEQILPAEVDALQAWLNESLQAPELLTRLGASCVWLAMQLGRSLFLVERLLIEPDAASEEWAFTADFKKITRTAPRRGSHWRPDGTQEKEKVATFANDLTLVVPAHIRKTLLEAAQAAQTTPESVGQVWRANSSERLDVWFGGQARAHFPRLTSAKLASYQRQRLFDRSGQFNFSRLLTSHPDSALPGSCSYSTWDLQAISDGLQPEVEVLADEPVVNAMGSLLVPLNSVLKDEVLRCTAELAQAAQKDLIAYHNRLAQYVVMALYAATGARPLRDPFESLAHFSLAQRCVFISDKNDQGLHSGRIAPLPEQAIKMLQAYVAFLDKLAAAIEPHRAELASQIRLLGQGSSQANMPLFFLLDSGLQWHSMANAQKLGCELFNWGLPANLFRHRYAQQLLKEGVHPEVIEGWMGHAERGVATYSDYSVRCWQQDAQHYVQPLELVFAELGFELPELSKTLPPLLYEPDSASDYKEPREFGQQARERHRRNRIKKALQGARLDIELILNGRSINELDETQLKQLGSRMLLRENRLPHPQAALRYRVLLKTLQREQTPEDVENTAADSAKDVRINPIRDRMLNQRLVQLGEERSLITAEVITSLTQYQSLKDWADQTRSTAFAGRIPQARALCVGGFLVAIEKRLGYQRMLYDLMQGQNFRLVQNKSSLHLEYSETLQKDDYAAAIQRHRISYKAASLLAYGIHTRNTVVPPNPVDLPELQGLLILYHQYHCKTECPSVENLLSWVCKVVNLANLVQLPGIVAAALSERQPPTSESLRDHARLLHGKALDLPILNRSETLPDTQSARPRGQETDKLLLRNNAGELSKKILIELQSYVPAKAREHAKQLRSICNSYQGKVSPAMLMLGFWIADLAATGKAGWRKKFSPYARNSLTTYWSSLAPSFRGLLYETDLVVLDSEELTELCAQMLEYKESTSAHADFFGKRLQDFFRWTAQFGVATPEWTELALHSDQRTVSSGLISEDEYQNCLTAIFADASLEQDEQLMLGFVLLATYRFGLRAQEAIGLLRRDWCQNGDYTWVLVQNSQYRTLKSEASRRAIPLLFALSETERDIIDRTLARYQSIAGNATNRLILCEAAARGKPPEQTRLAARIPETLIQLLRSVTGNPELVLHHCRHSFYNRVAAALLGLETPLANRLTDPAEHQRIRSIVLGPVNEVSRRSAMALARLMGHRFPSTGLKNYFHLATQWADELTPVKQQRAHEIGQALQIGKHACIELKPIASMEHSLQYAQPTLVKTLQCLRLMALGINHQRAGRLMCLPPDYTQRLHSTFEQTNARMRFTSSTDKRVKLKGDQCPNALLQSIPDDAWQRMLHRAGEIGDDIALELEDEEWQHLEDLPYLIGASRHVLMEQPGHIKLIRHVLELFQVPDTAYRVIAKDGSSTAMQRLQEAGFTAQYETEVKAQLDSFVVRLAGRDSQYQSKDYGGLVLSRQADRVVRSGLELAVVVFTVGSHKFVEPEPF